MNWSNNTFGLVDAGEWCVAVERQATIQPSFIILHQARWWRCVSGRGVILPIISQRMVKIILKFMILRWKKQQCYVKAEISDLQMLPDFSSRFCCSTQNYESFMRWRVASKHIFRQVSRLLFFLSFFKYSYFYSCPGEGKQQKKNIAPW